MEPTCKNCGRIGMRMATKKMCGSCYHKARKENILDIHKKPENCQHCNESFDKVRYYAKGKCQSCYNMLSKGRTELLYVKVKKGGNCQCGHPSVAKGMCHKCYNSWRNKNSKKTCKKCGCELDTPKVINICGPCKNSISTKSKRTFTQNDIDKMKILMVKAKWGFIGELETLRIIHLYLNIMYQDVDLDGMSTESCLKYCLLKFKGWVSEWDNNSLQVSNTH